MKRKLVKKYLMGGRPLYVAPLPSKDKWGNLKTITDVTTGEEFLPGDKVAATADGRMLTPENDPQAWADWKAAKNMDFDGPQLLNLTINYNPKTKEQWTGYGSSYDEYLEAMLNAPVATRQLLEKLWQLQGDSMWEQSHDKHLIDLRLADEKADLLSPGFWTFTSPIWIALAGILGFESGAALSSFAAAYPGAFSNLIGSTIGGELINTAVNIGSGGKYSDWGDFANQTFGNGDSSSELEKFLWGFTNLGYMANPINEAGNLIKESVQRLGKSTYDLLTGGTANRILNSTEKLNLGLGAKTAIYNTVQSLLYGPEVAAKAGLNHLKLKILDAGWVLKNSIRSKNFYTKMRNSTHLNPDLSTYKPSDRADALKYAELTNNLNEYLLHHHSGPNGHILYTKTMQPHEEFEGEVVPARIKVSSSLGYWDDPTYLFENPDIAKASLVTGRTFLPPEEEEILYSHAADALENPFTDRTVLAILTGGMSDLPVRSKEMGPEATEINALLGDLGHVTGSNVTYTNPYATHEPNDIDIITTEGNLQSVLDKLLGTIVSRPARHHIKIQTPKYGEMDVQLIERDPSGRARGRIALLTYQKIYPQAYYHNVIEGGNYTVPMSPEEMLRLHKANVLIISNGDLLVSGSDKHAVRNLNILRCPDLSIVKNATELLENSYRAHLGPDFLSIEDLGVKLDYSNVLNNLEFLNKLGLWNAEHIAEDPVRMEYLIKSLLYQTHTANRTVNGTGLTTTDILKSMHTNGSGSNLGGNNARSKFGGGIEYGESDPIVGMIEFPIKYPEELKTPMDVYKYLTKIIDLSDLVYYNTEGERFTNFKSLRLFSPTFVKNIFNDSKLDPEVALLAIDLLKPPYILDNTNTNMSSLLTFGVPNRNENLNLPIYYGWTYDPQVAEGLYTLNDNLARLFDINHIYSLLNGFGDLFVGQYARHIPNLRSTVVKGSDAAGNYFPGFELPTTSFISPKVSTFYVKPYTDLAHPMPSTKSILKARNASARNNSVKLKKADKLRRDAYDIVLRLRSSLYASVRKTKDRFKLAGLLGIGSSAIYGVSKIPVSGFVARQTARDIVNNINYKDTNELKKYLEDEEVYLTDELYKKLNELSKEGTSTNFYLELRGYINDYLKQHVDD